MYTIYRRLYKTLCLSYDISFVNFQQSKFLQSIINYIINNERDVIAILYNYYITIVH